MAEEGQVLGVHTVDAWNEQLQKELAKKIPTVTFLKVDVDELKSVATDWAVEAMPTFMFIKEGKIVDKVVGTKKDELQQTIAKHISSTSSA
ncbi:hypothetical protein K7X08_018365 [Anisodus acutangulus]|uniref:Thioredoxin domain-containing protein n=1 Tax=Anisodus acutangulus TaxID=402998 RepID=A0A9Q1LZ24_9SOLA|nr:hypothetical protein K7X08_018365 [Anisodus acutangulus]